MRKPALAVSTGHVHLVEERRRVSLCGRNFAESMQPLHQISLTARQSAAWCAACYALGSPAEVAEISTRFGLLIPPVEVASA